MVNPAVVTGILSPFLGAWIMGQLPKKGDSPGEIDRKLRNIIGSMLIGFGLGYLVTELTSKKEKTETISKQTQFVAPGYYKRWC